MLGYVISFAITLVMVVIILAIILRVGFLRNLAGLGNVAPTGPIAGGAKPATA